MSKSLGGQKEGCLKYGLETSTILTKPENQPAKTMNNVNNEKFKDMLIYNTLRCINSHLSLQQIGVSKTVKGPSPLGLREKRKRLNFMGGYVSRFIGLCHAKLC